MRRVAPWLPLVIATLGAAAALWLESIDDRGGSPTDPIIIPIALSYALVGALVAKREPRNAVGWLLSAFAVTMTAEFAIFRYAIVAYGGHGFGGGEIAASFSWLWLVSLAVPVFLAHLLPTGQPLSPSWTRLLGATAVMFVAILVVFALGSPVGSPGPDAPLIPNPLYVPAMGPVYEFLNAAYVIYFAMFGGGAAALIVRYRRSRGVERQQLKWIVVGIVSQIVLSVASNAASGLLNDALSAIALLPLPMSIGIAVLRYRLYDVDVIVRRSLIYAAVSAILLVVYIGVVAVSQAIVAPFTAGSGVAVAISTLAVVALFQPVRTRIQSAVDRRFYRSKYDAEHTLDAFATRLREQIDLGALERELLAAVDDALQPDRASVWLRKVAP